MSSREKPEAPAGAGRLLAALALIASSWPYLVTLRFQPMTEDAAIWIGRSAWRAPDWATWVFATRHFEVGYRPLTALTYALNSLADGGTLEPLGYRLVDLGLHVGAAALVYALFRRLAPRHPPAFGALAALLFAAHPGAEEVVPYLARRSYSMAALLGLAALLVTCRGLDPAAPPPTLRAVWRSSLAAGALLLAALLANETAYAVAALLPLLAWHRTSLAGAARFCAAPMALALASLALRAAVVGGVGGYRGDGPGPAAVALEIGRALTAWPASLSGVGGIGAAALLAAGLLWRVAAGLRGGSPLRSPGTVLLAWLLGATVLLATIGYWFPRELYALLAPFGLFVAHRIAEDWRAFGARPLLGAVKLAPPVALAGLVLAGSPALRGPDALRLERWRAHDVLLRVLYTEARRIEPPAQLLAVLPFDAPLAREHPLQPQQRRTGLPPRIARQAALWTQLRLGDHDVGVSLLAAYASPRSAPEAPPRYELRDGRPVLLFAPGQRYVIPGVGARRAGAAPAPLWLDPLRPRDRRAYLYVHADRRGRLLRLPGGPAEPPAVGRSGGG